MSIDMPTLRCNNCGCITHEIKIESDAGAILIEDMMKAIRNIELQRIDSIVEEWDNEVNAALDHAEFVASMLVEVIVKMQAEIDACEKDTRDDV